MLTSENGGGGSLTGRIMFSNYKQYTCTPDSAASKCSSHHVIRLIMSVLNSKEGPNSYIMCTHSNGNFLLGQVQILIIVDRHPLESIHPALWGAGLVHHCKPT